MRVVSAVFAAVSLVAARSALAFSAPPAASLVAQGTDLFFLGSNDMDLNATSNQAIPRIATRVDLSRGGEVSQLVNAPREAFSCAVALPSGGIVTLGGYANTMSTSTTRNSYATVDRGVTWLQFTEPDTMAARAIHSCVAVGDSRVLLVGGADAMTLGTASQTADLVDVSLTASAASVSLVAQLPAVPFAGVSAAIINDRVVVVGAGT